jgi:hypothetical protein
MTDAIETPIEESRPGAKFDAEAFLNTPHLPRNAGEFAPALSRVIARIPRNWGMWIGVGPGWYSLVTTLDEKIAELFPDYEIEQVKEKYGTLRYYCSVDGEDSVHTLIEAAEAASRVTCEKCGAPGKLGSSEGWWRTTCAEHAPEGFVPDEPDVVRVSVAVQVL